MKRPRAASGRQAGQAFTLLEMLVVLAIAAILVGISVPAYLQITQASVLTTASNQVLDQLNLARQEALSLNQEVEVRFYSLPSPNNSAVNVYRAMQPFGLNLTSNPASTNALSRPVFFPVQVQMASSTTLSTLLDTTRTDTYTGTGTSASYPLPSVGLTYAYTAFRFKSDGSTTLTSPLCLTLHLVSNPPGDHPAEKLVYRADRSPDRSRPGLPALAGFAFPKMT